MKLQCATFSADVTPPLGHPLCAGWCAPAKEIADPLYAHGIVLVGEGAPVVLCAVDFCEISNSDHLAWRQQLAQAVGTVPERVAVHCVHQHDAPFPDQDAHELVAQQKGVRHVMDVRWCTAALERVAEAAKCSMASARPITHLGLGEAAVKEAASNRRIMGADGTVKAVRYTACKDPAVRAEPEGLIDRNLKTISLWEGTTKLVSLHYYAVHPSHCHNDGRVTADCVGVARQRWIEEEGGIPHVYFTGCAGNVTLGKYNDGAVENLDVFAGRLYEAMVDSERRAEPVPVDRLEWRTLPVHLPPRPDMNEPELLRELADEAADSSPRIQAALKISYLRRSHRPIVLSSLHFSDRVCLLHLPGEAFIEYQLYAQQQHPDGFVAVASYGDCGPGYITLDRSFAEGGYEPKDAFVSGEAEPLMKDAIEKLVTP